MSHKFTSTCPNRSVESTPTLELLNPAPTANMGDILAYRPVVVNFRHIAFCTHTNGEPIYTG